MKADKFTGSSVEQLELGYSYLLAHKGHFLVFSLIDLDIAAIQCSTCKITVLQGSREFVECVHLQGSMDYSDT